MFVELPCRFFGEISKEVLDEIDADVKTKEVISSSEFDAEAYRNILLKEAKVAEYDNIVLSLADVFSFNSVDKDHTFVRLKNGAAFTFKLPYNAFMAIFEQVTGHLIKQIELKDGE